MRCGRSSSARRTTRRTSGGSGWLSAEGQGRSSPMPLEIVAARRARCFGPRVALVPALLWSPRCFGPRVALVPALLWSPRCFGPRVALVPALLWSPRCFGPRVALVPALLWSPRCFGPRVALVPALLWSPRCFGPRVALVPALLWSPRCFGPVCPSLTRKPCSTRISGTPTQRSCPKSTTTRPIKGKARPAILSASTTFCASGWDVLCARRFRSRRQTRCTRTVYVCFSMTTTEKSKQLELGHYP